LSTLDRKFSIKESNFQIPENFIYLNDIKEGKTIFILLALDQTFDSLITIGRNLKRRFIGLNWTNELLKYESIEETANHFLTLL